MASLIDVLGLEDWYVLSTGQLAVLGELPPGELPPVEFPTVIVSIDVRAAAYGEIFGGPKMKFPGRIWAKMSPSKKENCRKDIF